MLDGAREYLVDLPSCIILYYIILARHQVLGMVGPACLSAGTWDIKESVSTD